MRKHRDYKGTFRGPAGEAVLADLARRFHLTRPSYEPGMDAAEAAFREGQRSVVLHILTMLRLSEADIQRMLARTPLLEE